MVVKMSKLALLGIEDQREPLIRNMMELGAIEISEADEDEYRGIAIIPTVQDEVIKTEEKISTVQAVIDTLDKYTPEKRGFFENRSEITKSKFENEMSRKDEIWEVIGTIKDHEESLIKLKAEENRLNNTYMSLLPWRGLSVPLETKETQKTIYQIGTIPAINDWVAIESDLSEKAPYSVTEKINSDRDLHYISVIYHKDAEQECLSYLKSRGFNAVVFSGLQGTVQENLEMLKRRIEETSKLRTETIEQIKSITHKRESIKIQYDALCMERDRIKAAGKTLKTSKAFYIKGWIPENCSMEAKRQLESKYTVSVDIVAPAEDEEFPVLLDNKGIAEAGEPVSNMYSLPNSLEIDPNAVMSPFFAIFFGLMLSDGGYGIIMTLAAGIILSRFKLERSKRKFIKLIFYCGIATVFWGVMFGGWFGIDALTKYGIWMNPVEDPELLLSWSLLFGVIHMYAGFAINAANLIRHKKYMDSVFDVLFRLIFYTGFILVLLPYVPKVNKDSVTSLVNAGKYMLIIGVVLMIFTQGRSKKNIIGKFFGGLSSLYDVVGFMSDVLSYSRLLALGLATGIIASIINQMSMMFDFPLVFKIILAALILAVGHIINFAINALGAYVHSCRLQYLEFFGKFFTGGGKPFKPLKANTKYIVVKQDAEV